MVGVAVVGPVTEGVHEDVARLGEGEVDHLVRDPPGGAEDRIEARPDRVDPGEAGVSGSAVRRGGGRERSGDDGDGREEGEESRHGERA